MQDSADAMWATLLSGAHQVWHAAGWLEGGLVMSYEKFVMDLDHCGAMLKMLQGFGTDEESFGRDAYLETGPGENFLSTGHTLRHYARANFEPAIPEARALRDLDRTGWPNRRSTRSRAMAADLERLRRARTGQADQECA